MARAKAPPKRAHVIPGGEGFRCLNCGEEGTGGMAFPAPLTVWTAAAKAFEGLHKLCVPSSNGTARFRYSNPIEWARSWDVGVSSATIFYALTGSWPPGTKTTRNGPGETNWPHDPDDFGRCVRLVRCGEAGLGGSWRSRLHEVVGVFPAWAPFVDAWPRLDALYTEESGRAGHDMPAEGTKAPRLSSLIRECSDKAEMIRRERAGVAR